jgi:hypothetical protein
MKNIWERQEMHTEILAKQPDGKRPLGRPKCTWEDNIKNNLKSVRMWL